MGGWRRLGGVQEPSGRGRDARPGTAADGWLCASGPGVSRLGTGVGGLVTGVGGLGTGVGGLGVGIRLPRARDDQSRRNRPGGHEVFRVIPAEQAGTLPLFLPRVISGGRNATIPTRLVTFCIHHRPQSRHTFLAHTTVRRSSHFPVQTGYPAVKCYRLRASVYRGQFSEQAGPTSRPRAGGLVGRSRAPSWLS
jgi:hypothetical protein